MQQELNRAFNKNKLVSLCTGTVNWNKRIIGYITNINAEEIIIDEVDLFGAVIKQKTIAIKRITVLEVDDRYNQHLEKLKESGKTLKQTKTLYCHNKGRGFSDKINALQLKGSACTIFLNTEYITGIIGSVKENHLLISTVGYMGTKEGHAILSLDHITKIRYQGPQEAKMAFLLQCR